jgi:hypothetical protein
MKRMRRVTLLVLLATVLSAVAGRAEEHPDFSGTWKLSGERSVPPSTGDVTLVILHQGPVLSVETTMVRGSAAARHALQRYTIDGKPSVSTGADGDEFHTSVVWDRHSLVFSIEEHEDGRILPAKETWSLIESGSVLQRVRVRPGVANQNLVYLRR